MFNDFPNGDIYQTDFFSATSALPFHDMINAPSDTRATPTLSPRPRGSENRVSPTISPSKSEWSENDEEGRTLKDLGIPDPEEDEQLELFNSMRGAEDESEEEPEEGQDLEAVPQAYMDNGYGALEDFGESTEDADAYAIPNHGEYPTFDTDEVCDTPTAEELSATANDAAALKEDYSRNGSPERILDFVEPIAEPQRWEESSAPDEEAHAAPECDDEPTSDRLIEASIDTDVEPPREAVAPPMFPAPRRSARLANAPKREREDDMEDTPASPPAKRVKSMPVPRPRRTHARSTPASAGPRGKGKQREVSSEPQVAGPSRLKKDGKRLARIPRWFIEKKCVVNEQETVVCGFNGCKHVLHPKKAADARNHIRAHHTPAQLKAAEVQCFWNDCGNMIKNGQNNGELLRHYDEVHLRVRYECPGKCKDKQGKRRIWVRTDEITRHEVETPCKYLRDHPIPRGQTKDPDEVEKPKKSSKKSRNR